MEEGPVGKYDFLSMNSQYIVIGYENYNMHIFNALDGTDVCSKDDTIS
jgi:hypothetical protein